MRVRFIGLEWSRVDLVRKVAWLDHGTTKSGEGRGIPLNADAMAALESTLGQHPRWCFTFAGQRIRKSTTAWDKAKQTRGIEDFRFHDLRTGWKSYEMVLRRRSHRAATRSGSHGRRRRSKT